MSPPPGEGRQPPIFTVETPRKCAKRVVDLDAEIPDRAFKTMEIAMDFIEKLFGIAPDGGDGSLEVLWVAAIATTIVAVAFRRRLGAWLSQRSTSRH